MEPVVPFAFFMQYVKGLFGVSHKLFGFFHHVFTATEKRNTLVQFGWFYIHNSIKTIAGFAFGLFGQKSHWVTFVKQA